MYEFRILLLKTRGTFRMNKVVLFQIITIEMNLLFYSESQLSNPTPYRVLPLISRGDKSAILAIDRYIELNCAGSVVPFGSDSYREGTSAAEGLDMIKI
jgi:hypothetical protein